MEVLFVGGIVMWWWSRWWRRGGGRSIGVRLSRRGVVVEKGWRKGMKYEVVVEMVRCKV